MSLNQDPLAFVGDMLSPGVYRAIQDTKPLMAVLPSMDREEIEAGVMALRLSAGPALASSTGGPGEWELAQLAFWVRWLSMMPGPASPLDGPRGNNALCVYLAEKINEVWRKRPQVIEQPCNWPHAGEAETLTLAEACAVYGVLPHPDALDPQPRELLRAQLALPEALRLAAEGSHCFILEFTAATLAGRAAVARALLAGRGLGAVTAAALGRLPPHGAGALPPARFAAEDLLNARCAADLLHTLAETGVRTSWPQVGWAWDEQPGRRCALQMLAGRAADVALSKRALRGLLTVLRDTGRIVGHGNALRGDGPEPSLALDFCGAVARELLDRAHAQWRKNLAGDFIVDPASNHQVATLLLHHDAIPSFVDQYVDLLVQGGIGPDDVAIPAGPQLPGVAYGPVEKPMSFRDVFTTTLPRSCLAMLESRHREARMSEVIHSARQECLPANAAPTESPPTSMRRRRANV